MHVLSLLALPALAVALGSTSSLSGRAAPPSFVHYYARAQLAGTGIDAQIEFSGTDDGTSTFVKMRVNSGLDPSLSPTGTFIYHIHTNPVPPDGDCTGTFGHLDPLNVTESDTCDPSFPQYCQLGDLSGKHGAINGTATGAIPAFGYSDAYVRFFPAEFSMLGRSVVLHSSNLTRLACGNITSGIDGTADYFQMPTNKSSTFVTSFPTTPPAQPAVVITPFVNGAMVSNATLAGFNRPIPMPALTIAEALNVQLVQTTFTTMVNNSSMTVTLPDNVAVSDPPPFPGWITADWS